MEAIGPRYLVDFATENLPQVQTDVIVIGGGIAGLFTAVMASEQGCAVILVTKKSLIDSNTQYAQGGIAAVTAADDSPDKHRRDTLIAGAGLCDEDAVDVLVHEGPHRVQELIHLGAEFDIEAGQLALTREGAHSEHRILHAHGDATGAEIVRALSRQVLHNKRIQVWEEHFAVDLLADEGQCYGALVQRPSGEQVIVYAKATILSTGGAGQLYASTTNPDIATGDGIAMAYRAGAIVKDLEFIQFHPTALYDSVQPRFLISEALRGEGAYLRNMNGERFMSKYDERQELAPRDIVARAIMSEIAATRTPYVYIDMTHKDVYTIKQRFPTIYHHCLSYNLDLSKDWIPVAPAAHYMMGGVGTDLNGETSIRRLYACGEVAATGVHGANRLASNSLSEAIVFAKRITEHIKQLPLRIPPRPITFNMNRRKHTEAINKKRLKLQETMQHCSGLIRTSERMEKGYAQLIKYASIYNCKLALQKEYELANLLTCALLVTQSAMVRQESRGAHFREDYPQTDDLHWRVHTIIERVGGWHKEAVHYA